MAQRTRILFTGGSGKAGRHVVPYLLERGHRVVNVDLKPLDHPGVDNLIADITDSGQMFNVMTSYGICFADGRADPKSLPLDEDYDTNPMDSYALSKVVNEKTARAFQRRSGFDIYALRIGNVIEPHEYEGYIPKWIKDPAFRKRIAWSYIDARDLGQIVDLCIAKDGLGYQVFNAANDDPSADLTTQELLDRFYPKVPLKRKLDKYESLYSNRKIRKVLGFKQEHNWRKYAPKKK